MKDTARTAGLLDRIDAVLEELERHAQGGVSRENFYRKLLVDAGEVLHAKAAALWSPAGRLRGVDCATAEVFDICFGIDKHQLLSRLPVDELQREGVQVSGVRTPTAQATRWSSSNDAGHIIRLASQVATDAHAAVIAFYLPGPLAEPAETGCLRFVAELARIAAEFERTSLVPEMTTWQQFDRFSQALSRCDTAPEAAFAIANEARRLVACDRVFVLIQRSGRFRVTACSGVDSVDRQSDLVRQLEPLVSAIARLREPWQLPVPPQVPPPEIEECLHGYLDQSTVQGLAVLPLFDPARPDRVVGVLVLENFDNRAVRVADPVVQAISRHCEISLTRALERESWAVRLACWSTAPWRHLRQSTRWAKWGIAAGALAIVLAGLLISRGEFYVSVDGRLKPVSARSVFATYDGFIDKVYVTHGDRVEEGDPIAEIASPELDLELKRLLGELQTTQEDLAAATAERFQITGVDQASLRRAAQLTANELSLKEKETSLRSQLSIVQRQVQQLTLPSPIAGTVLDWDVEKRLQGRPVRRGQVVARVADVTGDWRVELEVPDDDVGHVVRLRETDAARSVTFVVRQEPNVTYQGKLARRDTVTQSKESGAAYVLMEATAPVSWSEPPRPGAAVAAKIHCGERSRAFLLFHDILEELRRTFF